MLTVKISSYCLHRDVISADKFRWFSSGKEPALSPEDISIATWVQLRVVHPDLALSGLVLSIKDNSPQVCVLSNPVRCVTSISLTLLYNTTLSAGEVWSRCEKTRPLRLKTGIFSWATNLVLSPEFMMDTSLLIVAQLELVMINVPSASKLAPSLTFERLVCHHDVAFVQG